MFKPGKAIVPTNGSGTAPDATPTPAGVEVSFDQGQGRQRQATLGVIVTNREAAGGNTLEVSFNNAGTWFLIATDTTLQLPVVTHRMQLRGTAGATADYSVLGIV